MEPWMVAITAGAVGAAVGAGGAWISAMRRRVREQAELGNARTRATLLDEQLNDLRARLERSDGAREAAERSVAAHQERLKAYEDAEKRLTDAFKALGAEALKGSTDQFIKLAEQKLTPFRELLDKHNLAVRELETKREKAYATLDEKIRQIATAHEKLNTQTARLVTALRRPEQRGRWGEMQLRNVVELAGMQKHCDFSEQPQTDDPGTRDRPDMTVHMPGGGVIVVDAKVALDSYLDALQPDADRDALLRRHADLVERHYRNLAGKRYWEQFERTPQFVVMFVPVESALVAALEHKPTLHSDAMQNHVLIATPMLLIALFRAIAYGWQQEALAENAREISEVGRELYKRLATFAGHFEAVGSKLGGATDAYNKAIGSLERMVLPSTRKLKDLEVTTEREIESPHPVEIEVRPVTQPELTLLTSDDRPDADEDENVAVREAAGARRENL